MREAIRKFILEKAKELFKRKGLKDTTMDEIAEISEISKPTLYKYFPSKEELFREVFVNINNEVDKEILASLNPKDDIFTNLERLIYKTIVFLLKHKEIMRIALFETGAFFKTKEDKKKHFATIFKNRSKRKNFLIKTFRENQKKGIIRKGLDPELIAISFLGIIKELSFEVLFLDLKIEDPQELAKKLLKIFIKGIKEEVI